MTARGFAITTAGQRLEYRWAQVRAFYTFERSMMGFRRRLVGIDFVPGGAGPFDTAAARWTDRVTTLAGSSTRAVRAPVGALPSTYGQQADELVNLLERWRRANTATSD